MVGQQFLAALRAFNLLNKLTRGALQQVGSQAGFSQPQDGAGALQVLQVGAGAQQVGAGAGAQQVGAGAGAQQVGAGAGAQQVGAGAGVQHFGAGAGAQQVGAGAQQVGAGVQLFRDSKLIRGRAQVVGHAGSQLGAHELSHALAPQLPPRSRPSN